MFVLLHGTAAVKNITLVSGVADINLRELAISSGWNTKTPLYLTLTINPGVAVYASSVNTYALRTGAPYPAGSKLKIVNNGYIVGYGGQGGWGGGKHGSSTDAWHYPYPGQAGGPALFAEWYVAIDNRGVIGGGGGGGGGGGFGPQPRSLDLGDFGDYPGTAGGGGGGGAAYGAGGNGTGWWYHSQPGQPGGLSTGGSGGNGAYVVADGSSGYGGNGGKGGDLGQYGAAGVTTPQCAGAPGGAPGNAVTWNNYITWINYGTVLGPVT